MLDAAASHRTAMSKRSRAFWPVVLALTAALVIVILQVAIYCHIQLENMMIYEFERVQIGAPVPHERFAASGLEVRSMIGDSRPQHIAAYFQMARPNVKEFDVVEVRYYYLSFH